MFKVGVSYNFCLIEGYILFIGTCKNMAQMIFAYFNANLSLVKGRSYKQDI